MNIYHSRPTVADIRAMKAAGKKISMVYVSTLEEARAAAEAGIHMLSIEARFFTPEMREAAGNCFVQVGLPYGPFGDLVTAEDYLEAAFHYTRMGGDCFYCAASNDIIRTLADNGIPVVGHVGLIPSQCTWTGGFKAVGKTADTAMLVARQVKALEDAGAFGAELEVVPDRVAEVLTKNSSLIMLGMGAGAHADAQYLFAEDILGYTPGHRPRHAKVYRDFATEFARLQTERVSAFKEFIADVNSGEYPQASHVVPIADDEFEAFLKLYEA